MTLDLPDWDGTRRALMPRNLVPFSILDLSTFAKNIRRELAIRPGTLPTHLELLNILARANGSRNYQHMRAEAVKSQKIDQSSSSDLVSSKTVERCIRFFDSAGIFKAWPARTSLQNLCLWVLWARIPDNQIFNEREISQYLDKLHTFGDAATLRRTLCSLGLMSRSKDGSTYQKQDKELPADARTLIGVLDVAPR